MDEAQKIQILIRRVLRKLSRAKIQDWIAITQTIIAALMLWSLWESHETLLLTKRQIESSITPVLGMWQGGSELHFENQGSVPISKLEVVARLAAHYDIEKEKIVDFQLSNMQEAVCEELNPSEKINFNFEKLTLPVEVYFASGNQLEAYCLILRYWRSADMKPNYKLVYFYRLKANSPASGYLFFPIGIVGNGGMSGPFIPFKNLKAELRNVCLQQLDLPGLEEN
jgi:hypothetical protein